MWRDELVKPVVLVIGLGEVGLSLFELLKESRKFIPYGWDSDRKKMRHLRQEETPKEVDIMHICYRCQAQTEFIKSTVAYMSRFSPKLTIINSTVPPSTTAEIHRVCGGHIAHSPIRGMHKTKNGMKAYLQSLTKYIGGIDYDSARLSRKHFEHLGLKVKVLKHPIETELGKLFETTYRAWMIACFQEMHRISRYFEADFDEVVSVLEDDHRVRLDRPIMFPDVIGGHCLIPNTELLLKSYDSDFFRLILKSNQKRKREIKNKDVMFEVNKVKQRVKTLERELARASRSIANLDEPPTCK